MIILSLSLSNAVCDNYTVRGCNRPCLFSIIGQGYERETKHS